MPHYKEFPFHKARRITPEEVESFRIAIEQVTGKKRKRRGRPPKLDLDKYQPISLRLHPNALKWAKAEAKKRGMGYQTLINQILLKKIA